MREVKSSFVANAAMITIANSADKIGVYIPLFAEYSLPQMLITVIVFTVMTFLWCILGEKIATLAPIQNTIQKYKRIAIPLIYILLGIYILIF
jgi:cadmium resistance protein CadD (predicted permease)